MSTSLTEKKDLKELVGLPLYKYTNMAIILTVRFVVLNHESGKLSLGKYIPRRLKYAVIAPEIIKVHTAVSERIENLDNPHKPWPEVQPDPSLVPNPVRIPAVAITDGPNGRVPDPNELA